MYKILFFLFVSQVAIGQNRMFQSQNGNVKGAATATTSLTVITNGLVLNLDAGNSASYTGTGTTWTDLSGSANNGTLINSPTYNSSNGGYFNFNGSTQYVTLTPTKLPTGTSDRTVIAFVKTPTTVSGYQHIIHWGSANGGQAFGLTFLEGIISSHIWNSGPTQGGVKVSAATNYFFAVTYTHASTLHKFWINGVSQGSGVSSSINTGTADARIAQRITGYEDMGPNGQIYQVLVYNRALSDEEILQIFNAQKGRYGL
jgi:hypothetical protein